MHAIHDLVIILLEVHTMGAFVPLAQRYMLRHITTAILEATQMSSCLYQTPLKYLWRATQRTGQRGELKRGTRVRSGTVNSFHYIDFCIFYF